MPFDEEVKKQKYLENLLIKLTDKLHQNPKYKEHTHLIAAEKNQSDLNEAIVVTLRDYNYQYVKLRDYSVKPWGILLPKPKNIFHL